MRLPLQVGVFLFRRNGERTEFLLLKRTPAKGDFWQSISGGVEDDETIHECMRREIEEEAGVTSFSNVVDNLLFYQYEDPTYRSGATVTITQLFFGAEVPMDTVVDITKNHCKEHTESSWCLFDEAIALLKWDSNKEALRNLQAVLANPATRRSSPPVFR